MTRAEFINTREFWLTEIQLQLFELIENYRKENNLNKTQLAEKLGVTKSYVTQVMNGDFDHKISKLVDIALAFGKVPILHFVDTFQYIQDDKQNKQHIYRSGFNPVNYIVIVDSDNLKQKEPAEKPQKLTLDFELQEPHKRISYECKS